MEKYGKKSAEQTAGTREHFDSTYTNLHLKEQRFDRGLDVLSAVLNSEIGFEEKLDGFLEEIIVCKEYQLAGKFLGVLGSARLGKENTCRILALLERPSFGIQVLGILKENLENELPNRLDDDTINKLIDAACSDPRFAIVGLRVALEVRNLKVEQYMRIVQHLARMQRYNCDPALMEASHIPDEVKAFARKSCLR